MKDNRATWREAFVFTRSELRGLRLLTLLLAIIILARVCYFRCYAPPCIEFSIPPIAQVTDTTSSNRSTENKSRLYYSQTPTKSNSRRWQLELEADSLMHHQYQEPHRRSLVVELNSADTLDLRALPSIGPWLARKIVEYRERLGGFYKPDQLLEVFRLTPGKLDTIWPYIRVDTSAVRRIDINRIAMQELMMHPYLSRSQARGLVAYREKHGAFNSVEDLKKCLVIDEKTFDKMRNYVEVR